MRSNERSNVRSNERSNVRSNEKSNVRSNERSNVRSNERSNVRSNERSNVRSNERSNVRSNERSNVRSNERSNVRSNERSNERSHERFDVISGVKPLNREYITHSSLHRIQDKRVPNYLCIFQNSFLSAKMSLFIKYCGRHKIIIKKSQLLRIKKQVRPKQAYISKIADVVKSP